MRTLQLFSTLMMLIGLVATSEAAPRGESPHQAAIQTYRALDPAGQQQWLRTLVVDRMQPAAELALSVDDLARQQKFATQVLQRAASGRTLSDDGVKTLLSRSDQLEKSAIEKLARLYRVGVYQAFRSDRREYDLRMAAWRRVELAFADAGGTPQDRPLLLSWLQESVNRLNRGNVAMLPAMPRFGASAPQIAKAMPRSYQPTPAVPLPTVRRSPSTQPSTIAPPKVAASPPTVRPPVDPTPAAIAKTHLPPAVALPADPRSEPTSKQPAPPQITRHVVERPVQQFAPSALAQPIVTHPATAQTVRTISPPATVAPPANHSGPAVQVDLDELTIRITGYNLALQSLASRVHESKLNLAGLEEAVQELAELAGRRGDLLLYFNLLPNSVRQQVTGLDSYTAIVSLLGGKISAARKQLSAADFTGTAAERRQSLADLDILSRQLAQLAATQQ